MNSSFEKFLESVDSDVQKIFDNQKEYIYCKKGCSLCCERGDYPISEIEFEYLMQGFEKLPEKLKNAVKEKIKILKQENKESYVCPFLFNHDCSIYKFRPFVCRFFGVLTEDAYGKPVYPFCTAQGLNFSEIYDKKTGHLSFEKALSKNFKNMPKFFRLNNQVLLNLPHAKELNIHFGCSKRMIDFL